MQSVHSLRLSLLVSLGFVPLACGGSTSDGSTNQPPNGGSGGGQAGTSSQAGTAGVSMGGSLNLPSCTAPRTDPITGLVTCQEGYQHRPKPVACGISIQKAAPPGGNSGLAAPEPALPRATGDVPCGDAPEACNAYQYGYCDAVGGGAAPAVCLSGCITDEECGNGAFCACGNPQSPTTGVCQAASCRTDGDCGDYRCAVYNTPCNGPALACLGATDECRSDAECETDGQCTPFDDGANQGRRCILAACGRPFLVQAEQRVAPVTTSAAWSEPARPRVDHLSAPEREAHAAHFTRLGQLEHASIAAFARFSLQLLSLGAPPELVDAATRALADETAHAKLCFGLASAYAGRAVGPGPLDVTGSLVPSCLGEIVELVLEEGCFGETGAALEALAGAQAALDPVIGGAYARIAADEERHAQLAFRFIAWALGRERATVSQRITACLAALARHPAHAVAAPCLEALLSQARRATADDERELGAIT